MTRQLHSELLKLRTTRTTAVLFGAAAALTIFGAAVEGLSRTAAELAREDGQRAMFNAAGSTVVIMATLAGLIAMTSEFRFGTIRATLLAEPRRGIVLAAKLATAAVTGAALAVVCVAAALGTGLAILATRGAGVALTGPHAAALFAGPLFAAPLGAMLGVAVGALIRQQAGAIAAVAVYAVLVDALLFSAVPTVARYLPGKAGDALTGRPVEDLLTPGVGAAVLAAWTLAFIATAIVRTDRTDIQP
jgi:ABC-2 type transport system permease protein